MAEAAAWAAADTAGAGATRGTVTGAMTGPAAGASAGAIVGGSGVLLLTAFAMAEAAALAVAPPMHSFCYECTSNFKNSSAEK